MSTMTPRFSIGIALLIAAPVFAQPQDHTLGYDNTPTYPGFKWRVHDSSRPRPAMATPGTTPGAAPSDAVVLFDGRDLSQWNSKWKVENGYVECVPRQGGMTTKAAFGDIQLHVEWASPAVVEAKSQDRGNSGIILQGKYEVQVLDSWENPTYADGQAGSIYGQYPPLVNASKKPGEWQTYDIVFESPKFDGDKLLKPAYITVIHNGILVQNHEEVKGTTPHAVLGSYKAHGDLPLELQNHNTKVRYRNIWVRKLTPRT